MLLSPFLGLIFMKICIGLKLEGLVTACRTKQENAEEKLCGACRVASRVKRFALLWENGSECSRHLIRLRLISAANERQSGLSHGFPEFDNSLGWLTFFTSLFHFLFRSAQCFGSWKPTATLSQLEFNQKIRWQFSFFFGGFRELKKFTSCTHCHLRPTDGPPRDCRPVPGPVGGRSRPPGALSRVR